jgi:hypothetical protein
VSGDRSGQKRPERSLIAIGKDLQVEIQASGKVRDVFHVDVRIA